jgi:predicted ATPase
MGNAPAEILKIENFLSISYMEWKIQRLNVITGDMAAGKSLCMKLLKFFEDTIPNLLSSGYECFCKNMNKDNYFKHIAVKFNNIFTFLVTDPPKQKRFTITYTFSYNEEKFDMIIEGSNEENIVVKSSYIEKLLQEWGNLLQNNKELSAEKPEDLKEDSLIEFKNTLYNDVLKKFDGNFPVGTAFVPASRAALVVSSNYSDYYLRKYNELLGIVLSKQGKNDRNVNDILKAQIIINDELYLKSNDDRIVPINKASSGQQEIVFALMQLDRLGNNGYKYGKSLSLFIEEPSAHLFPLGQMQIINYIVQVYNDLKKTDKPVRFFITTHSPYILNSLNNILRKGALLKKYPDKAEIINRDEKVAETPVLSAEEVSAYFIEADGKGEDMFDPEDKDYIYTKKIINISRMIDEIDGLLSDLDDEFQE